ncbi:MAG: cobalamin biosynthesis protein [Oscillibacter sp.]|nr:cobalamin biosynthesis protein [Oscillibacter sp.]
MRTEETIPIRSGIGYLSFTDRGAALAETICSRLGGEAARCGPGRREAVSLSGWTAEAFPAKRALVYVGAAGIAVRAIAPYVRDKSRDPAVVAVDEQGRFVVPLLSGHLGGANDLARAIAEITGTAVITSATDLRGVFAVDDWARRQDCAVVNPAYIKKVSGALLDGRAVRVRSAFPICGTPPEGVVYTEPGCTEPDAPVPGDAVSAAQTDAPDVWVDIRRPADCNRDTLYIAPRVLVLGVGCKQGTTAETLESRFQSLCRETELLPEAFQAAATIDRKAEELGLLSFCARRGWPLYAYTAEELRQVPGAFTASAFVEETVGVGNVCERAAVLGAGEQDGTAVLLVKKYAGEGVALAAAQRPVRLDWTSTADTGSQEEA